MNSFFSLLFRQKYITRWGLMRNTTPESLAEHSAQVAAIAHVLAVIGNRLYGKHYDTGKIVCIALYHDAAEVFTGDMPTPVKYFSPEMRSGYGLIEKQAAEKLISKLPEELRDEYTSLLSPDDAECERIVKIADKLCAYIKCLTEEASGNREFLSAKRATEEALDKFDSPELDYFREKFICSFLLTLDEM